MLQHQLHHVIYAGVRPGGVQMPFHHVPHPSGPDPPGHFSHVAERCWDAHPTVAHPTVEVVHQPTVPGSEAKVRKGQDVHQPAPMDNRQAAYIAVKDQSGRFLQSCVWAHRHRRRNQLSRYPGYFAPVGAGEAEGRVSRYSEPRTANPSHCHQGIRSNCTGEPSSVGRERDPRVLGNHR